MPHKDPEVRKAYLRKYWHEHREKARAKQKRWEDKAHPPQYSRQRNIEYVKAYLLGHPCIDCGEKDIIVLEFDHKDRTTKYKAIAHLIGGKLETLITEIEKCEVRCANCHKRKTAKQFGWWRL